MTPILNKYFMASAKTRPIAMSFEPPIATASWPPNVEAFCIKKTTFFFPHRLWPDLVSFVPCPALGCSAKTQCSGKSHPRWVYNNDDMELLISSVHRCKLHSGEFAAHEVLHLLPDAIRDAFPFVLNHSSALSKS